VVRCAFSGAGGVLVCRLRACNGSRLLPTLGQSGHGVPQWDARRTGPNEPDWYGGCQSAERVGPVRGPYRLEKLSHEL